MYVCIPYFGRTLSALCVQVGRTPLMAAAQYESVDTAQLLAKYSKKKNHLDKVGSRHGRCLDMVGV